MSLADDLRNIEVQLNKAKAEVSGKIEALEKALDSYGQQPQEITDAVAALKAVSQNLDDVVPDVVASVVEAEAVVTEAEAAPEVEAVESVEAVETVAALVEALEAAEDETPA